MKDFLASLKWLEINVRYVMNFLIPSRQLNNKRFTFEWQKWVTSGYPLLPYYSLLQVTSNSLQMDLELHEHHELYHDRSITIQFFSASVEMWLNSYLFLSSLERSMKLSFFLCMVTQLPPIKRFSKIFILPLVSIKTIYRIQ